MKLKMIAIAPAVAAAGIAIGLAGAPTAAAIDPCSSAVSTSRCLGPQGTDGGSAPVARPGTAQNGPYGPWGNMPPLG
ncbi:hypothetical protein [Mycolicibacterium sediminis]|uniref:Intersectin-EH binding protein Ibp1 n=1 Tax=Mycolicibacterium sediminis TaxID=1286180 RepID=A0A7I7QP89_9MYCO|nr:hypothetical protein [Mycolicibacterium sediminis]BBY27827.1 hypothetical protein MSEDJ_19230 [Mycolicibacterium sediminis]